MGPAPSPGDSVLCAGILRPLVPLGKEGSEAGRLCMGALQPPVQPSASLSSGQWVNTVPCPARCGCPPAIRRSVLCPQAHNCLLQRTALTCIPAVCVRPPPRSGIPLLQQSARHLHPRVQTCPNCQSSSVSEAVSTLLVTVDHGSHSSGSKDSPTGAACQILPFDS